MARVAFLLAGQGAQKPGMGRSLYEHSPAARALFDALEAIRPGTLEMCFSGSAQELSQTANTQPCVFAVDMACAAAAQEAGLVPAFLAGFSLGELAGVALSGMLPVEDSSVVTSGVYERYFYEGDTLYHHILNPATGYPYENNLLSVTILSPRSVDGDGLSTTCFALGLEEGTRLIESLDGIGAMFITDDYEIHWAGEHPELE